MSLVAKGKSKIKGGPSYQWALEDAGDTGSWLMVAIGEWEITRSYPTMLTSADAAKLAATIAPELLTLIKSAS